MNRPAAACCDMGRQRGMSASICWPQWACGDCGGDSCAAVGVGVLLCFAFTAGPHALLVQPADAGTAVAVCGPGGRCGRRVGQRLGGRRSRASGVFGGIGRATIDNRCPPKTPTLFVLNSTRPEAGLPPAGEVVGWPQTNTHEHIALCPSKTSSSPAAGDPPSAPHVPRREPREPRAAGRGIPRQRLARSLRGPECRGGCVRRTVRLAGRVPGRVSRRLCGPHRGPQGRDRPDGESRVGPPVSPRLADVELPARPANCAQAAAAHGKARGRGRPSTRRTTSARCSLRWDRSRFSGRTIFRSRSTASRAAISPRRSPPEIR